MARIEWSDAARRALNKLPAAIGERILDKLEDVSKNPTRYITALQGDGAEKLRVGDYRVFVDYDRRSDALHVLAISHRRNAYK